MVDPNRYSDTLTELVDVIMHDEVRDAIRSTCGISDSELDYQCIDWAYSIFLGKVRRHASGWFQFDVAPKPGSPKETVFAIHNRHEYEPDDHRHPVRDSILVQLNTVEDEFGQTIRSCDRDTYLDLALVRPGSSAYKG
jgi:hypothetical protein